MRYFFLLLLWMFCAGTLKSQNYTRVVLKENREKLYQNLVKNSINTNLSQPLSAATEEAWESALIAIELLQYKSPFVNLKIAEAARQLQTMQPELAEVYLRVLCGLYNFSFVAEVENYAASSKNPKLFALCIHYLLSADTAKKNADAIGSLIQNAVEKTPNDLIFTVQKEQHTIPYPNKQLKLLLQKDFLAQNIVVFSFQRKNRNQPGLAIVRDAAGDFIKNDNDSLFYIPQLARSVSNIPWYISNGNTPQGIYRMRGFEVSKTSFIGPTPNVQLNLPFEFKAAHFYKNDALPDTVWSLADYQNLLPPALQNYEPLHQAYTAGKLGRTGIIAHGSTVNPNYYISKLFSPIVPTQGCLAGKEIWDEKTGHVIESDQQKLVTALLRAGGANGYYIVVELNDANTPVTFAEIMALFKN